MKTSEESVLFDLAKAAMGYHDGTKCCGTCRFYRECDCSGNVNAEDEHCARNAFHLPIVRAGLCQFYEAKIKP